MHIWEMLHIEQGIKYIGIRTEKTLEVIIKQIVTLDQNIIMDGVYLEFDLDCIIFFNSPISSLSLAA